MERGWWNAVNVGPSFVKAVETAVLVDGKSVDLGTSFVPSFKNACGVTSLLFPSEGPFPFATGHCPFSKPPANSRYFHRLSSFFPKISV